MAPPVGLILGHSFIHGLSQHIDSHHAATPGQVAHRLKLDHIIDKIYLHGQRGALVCSPSYELPHRILKQAKPDFVILELGTNDLAAGFSPFQVANRLEAIGCQLKSHYHVTSVTFCAILNRQAQLHNLTPDQFATAAYETNNYLRHYAAGTPNYRYHKHPGFWTPHISTWSRDGIHPNTTAGRRKYITSIRQAAFHALESFTSS